MSKQKTVASCPPKTLADPSFVVRHKNWRTRPSFWRVADWFLVSRRFLRATSDERQATKGFTFVEILLTMVIIAVSAAPLMQLFATAVEQTGTVDEIRTALDLSREEIEKMKNLALTETQLKSLGNVVSSPIFLNRTVWFTVRIVDPDASPLKITVFIFRDSLATQPVVSLVTILSK